MERHSVGVGFIKLLLVLVTMWQNSATVILGMEHQFLGSDNSNNSTSSPSSVLLEMSYPNVKIGPYNWRYFRGKNHHSHIHLLLGFLLRSSSSFYPNASRLICNVFHWGILSDWQSPSTWISVEYFPPCNSIQFWLLLLIPNYFCLLPLHCVWKGHPVCEFCIRLTPLESLINVSRFKSRIQSARQIYALYGEWFFRVVKGFFDEFRLVKGFFLMSLGLDLRFKWSIWPLGFGSGRASSFRKVHSCIHKKMDWGEHIHSWF